MYGAEVATDQAEAGNEGAGVEANEEVQRWSWLGRKSRLMKTVDEPKWILERLMAASEEE